MAPNTRSSAGSARQGTDSQVHLGARQSSRPTETTNVQRSISEASENGIAGIGHGTDDESSQASSEEDETLERLRRDLQRRKKRNDVLAGLVAECRREFGSDLEKYPSEVAVFARIQQLNEVEKVKERETTGPQRNTNGAPVSRSKPSHASPEPYEGKNTRERIAYDQACHRVFDYSPTEFETDYQKISWAATFLKSDKEPAKSWHRLRLSQPEKLDTMTWAEYIAFLDALILRPNARRSDTSRKYNKAKQGEKQSILSFVHYLEELETELEPLTERQLRDNLFFKLRDDLQIELTKSGMASRAINTGTHWGS
jgi:hypothetical protein